MNRYVIGTYFTKANILANAKKIAKKQYTV